MDLLAINVLFCGFMIVLDLCTDSCTRVKPISTIEFIMVIIQNINSSYN